MEAADDADAPNAARLVTTPEDAYIVLRELSARCSTLLQREIDASTARATKATFFEAMFVLLANLHNMLREPVDGKCSCDLAGIANRWLTLANRPHLLRSFPLLVVRELGPAHPLLCVVALRERIERTPRDAIDIAADARDMRCSSGSLAKLFRRHTGVSMLEYQRFVRVREGLRQLSREDTKVEAVALNVGLSKKRLYQYVGACVGRTPAQFRRLSASQREEHLSEFDRISRDPQRLRVLLSVRRTGRPRSVQNGGRTNG